VEEGEAAFYGPKIDMRVKDSQGRYWQLATVQLDFNQPENFDMNYVGEDGKLHKVVVVHVAIFGSFERFMGVIIEHFYGIFPTWLSPVQVVVLPVSEKHAEYAEKIQKELKENGIRSEIDLDNDTLGKKIRNAKMQKVPYIIVIGDKEMESNTLTIESRTEKLELPLPEFLEKIRTEIKERK
jgi:threonyl-tRNA synthetase